ncbi:hypothetical protein FRACYDRAFT_238564 [Fragilariopsis cylindrus CCMP1102]|uniref:Uncharacterized protein n=1 Tax=Fragilariopsis cylindrus CCMP1102 TaxID=635003 RepID=A0A1E7FIX8_9STRA|nr:hypothetical protein FRACYDRAFT_238564 [Fragilariopsis cylindrus CCMP1102]|eukprot:OEU18130.1 hypothetical protein FRACYDRAFT_238564 [Fragilariopsis cylindrus CCMP1102]
MAVATRAATSAFVAAFMSSSSKQSKSQGGRGRRSVRFKQHIEIRTYSIVLWCEDGYSIELGNDVLSVDRNGLKNDCSQRRPPHCRSFNERKQLLIDVGGYTEKELKEYLGCPHRLSLVAA